MSNEQKQKLKRGSVLFTLGVAVLIMLIDTIPSIASHVIPTRVEVSAIDTRLSVAENGIEEARMDISRYEKNQAETNRMLKKISDRSIRTEALLQYATGVEYDAD